ncbi:MAG: AAA family ATPase [Novosphingobium sp.]|nr:AAA family ATPase [Novosphingobium sp.]
MLKFKFPMKIGLLSLIFINNTYINIYSRADAPDELNNLGFMDNIFQYKVDQDPSGNDDVYSGYHALKNGLLILDSIKDNSDPSDSINDEQISKDLFKDPNSKWGSFITNLRIDNIVTETIIAELVNVIRAYQKENNGKNNNIIYYLLKVINNVIDDIKNNYLIKDGLITISKISAEDILNTFVDNIIKKFAITDKDRLIALLPKFKEINFKLSDDNVEILSGKNLPEKDLSAKEITMLYEFENDGSNASDAKLICINNIKKDISSVYVAANNIFNSDNTLIILNIDSRWMTCVAKRIEDGIKYFVVDVFNTDLTKNTIFTDFIKRLEEKVKELNDLKVKEIDLLNNNNNNNNNNLLAGLFAPNNPNNHAQNNINNVPEVKSYKSPYFDMTIDQFPDLSEFFNGKIPNIVINLIDKLSGTVKNNFKTASKKGLILYGPPGTGKSTIAEIIARQAGREVIFIDGGSFKTEYQGSGSRIVSELFEAARAKKKPVVIVIDEIDGATPKLRKNFGSTEDNQTMKKLIGELNNNLLSKDSSIYLICTTNYLENIEGAILSRFDTIELSAPEYNARLKILSSYLKNHDIEIEDENNSDTYEISREFLKMLATATIGWTGRDLQAIVNNAVSEYSNPKLSPENDSLWKFTVANKFDFRNRKLRSAFLVPFMGWIPLFAYKKNYTKLEKFLYSSYISERQKMNKIREAENESNGLYSGDSSILKQFKSALITTTVGMIVSKGMSAIVDLVFNSKSTPQPGATPSVSSTTTESTPTIIDAQQI